MFDLFKDVFLIACAAGKYYMPFNQKTNWLYNVHKIAAVLFAVVLLIVLHSILFPFAFMYFCLDNILKLKYGQLYGGMLNGTDVIFETKEDKCVINMVFIFTCKEDPLELIKKLKERAFQLHQSNFKFSSKIKSICGYQFFLKNQVEFKDITQIVQYNDEEYITKSNLLDYLQNNSLAAEKDHVWNVVFFSQPIRWHTSQPGTNQLAVLLTFRHAIGDYPPLIGYIKKYFQLTEILSISKSDSRSNNIENDLNIDNVRILLNPLTIMMRVPLTLGDNLRWLAATFIEEEVEYLPKIKKIKQALGVTFMETLSAAVAASISDYVKQRGLTLNTFIMGAIVRPCKKEISEIVNRTFNFENLANTFGPLVYTVPFESKEKNMKSRILDIHDYNQHLAYSVDTISGYVLLRYLVTYLPAKLAHLLRWLFTRNVTAGISNMVGLSASTCCGSTVDDIFIFAPNFGDVGCAFFVHSYDERLQVTAVCRKQFVRDREELEKILNNVFKNIDEAARDIIECDKKINHVIVME